MSSLKEVTSRFEKDMWNSYSIPLQKHHYNAHIFRQYIEDYGAVQAAKNLIESDDIPYGLTKLCDIGRLDLSAEALILKPEYKDLFTTELRKIARQRLRIHYEYKAPWDTGE
ncbi:hypothetical protein [Dictyobacter formicarum]|uniref:Uncharacterized protein n=1 Tax=Dictyobacter formicarum TaxID=2778368 RepID=A0ABQ3VGD4_9CHLR|nr:hypothetical protein [Dictyobacter formicarum]GHO85242.1 hypothetical protein KSZ_32480 [Dictyobacter formicarum]